MTEILLLNTKYPVHFGIRALIFTSRQGYFQNSICVLGCSKHLSHCNRYFEHPQHYVLVEKKENLL